MSNWRELGDLTKAQFKAEMEAYRSPMLAELDAVYAALKGHTIFASAILFHEKKFDTYTQIIPRAYHNPFAWSAGWANGAHIWHRFASYAEAAEEWLPWILSEGGPFANTRTVAEFVHRYAPASDGNDERRYVEIIEGYARTYGEGEDVALRFRQAFIPAGNRNRPGTPVNPGGPHYITVHETGNTRVGTDAENHRVFTHGGGGEFSVSFHLVVDDTEAIQLLPFSEIGYHAGDGCDSRPDDLGCFDSIAIETCVNSDGNWEQTLRNLITLLTKLIRENPALSVERIRQHNRWSGKNCPQRIRESGRWEWLISEVRRELDGAPAPTFQGLPAWLPAEFFVTAFPSADPSGVVTKRVIKWIADNKKVPIFAEKRDVSTGKNLWVFDDATFLNDGNKVWVEGEALPA